MIITKPSNRLSESMLQLKDLLAFASHCVGIGFLLGYALGTGLGAFIRRGKSVPLYQSQATVFVRDYSISVLQDC